MAGLRVQEAAQLVGKSVATLWRWQRQGIDITDREAILQHSQLLDLRSRGQARSVARLRGALAEANQVIDADYRAAFRSVTDPEEFVQVPRPYRQESAARALALLGEIRAGFARRLEELKSVGHKHAIELAEDELAQVTEACQILEMLFEGFSG